MEKFKLFWKQIHCCDFECVLQILGIIIYGVYFKVLFKTINTWPQCILQKKKKAGQDPESWWSPVIQQQEARTWTSLTFWGDLMIKDGALSLCFLPWRNKLNPQNSPDGWIHRKHTGVTLLHGLPVVRENWAL